MNNLKTVHIILALLLSMAVWAEEGLKVTTTNRVGGTVTATLVSGRTYSVQAVATAGYTFAGWSDGETSATRTYEHLAEASSDKKFDAIFTKDADVTKADGYTVVSVKDASVPSFWLEAKPNTGVSLYKWNNGLTDTKIAYIESEGTRIPLFSYIDGRLKITETQHVGGTVTTIVVSGRTCSIAVTPNDGYIFLGWSDDLSNKLNPREYTHASDADNKEIFAVFAKEEDLTRKDGHVEVSVDNPTAPSFYLNAVKEGEASFYKWNNGSNVPQQSYVETDGTRIPYFAVITSRLFVTTDQHVGGTVTATQVEGRKYSFLAEANDGYTFLGWTDNLDPSLNPREYTHEAEATVDKLFYAVFSKDEDTSLPGGTVSVGVNSATTPSFDLTAVPGETCVAGTSVYKWSTGSTDNPMLGYKESDGRCIPYFTRGNNAVGYEKDEKEGGVIEVAPLECGFHLKAVPNEGYAFAQWQDDVTELADRTVDYVAGLYKADFAPANFKVGDQYYVTLDEAAAHAGDEAVEMIGDVADVTVSTDANLDANGHEITNLTIACGGKLTLTEALTVSNLYLNSTAGSSAQLLGEDKLTYTNVYMDIQLDPNATVADPSLWYAFTLPFQVDVASGIARKEGSASHVVGKDYLVCEYKGDVRASTGDGWDYMNSGTLTPGKFYMLTIDGTQNIWRFTKKDDTPLSGGSVVNLYQYYTSSCKNRGWNAVGNSTLHYADAQIESGISIVQVYANGAKPARYDVKNTNESSFVVGTPFFVQTENDDVMNLSNATHGQLYAPTRSYAQAKPYYRIALNDAQGTELDVAYLTTSDDAKNEYVIGKDVIKMMGGNGNAYLWLSDYGYKLCAKDAVMADNVAKCYVGLTIPKNGTYTISVTGPDNVALYQNDGFVWPNAKGGFDLDLLRGTTTDILLQVGTERGIATSINHAERAEGIEASKFILDGHLYISCDDAIYNAVGSSVK